MSGANKDEVGKNDVLPHQVAWSGPCGFLISSSQLRHLSNTKAKLCKNRAGFTDIEAYRRCLGVEASGLSHCMYGMVKASVLEKPSRESTLTFVAVSAGGSVVLGTTQL